jgi:hypothetical protein
LNVSAVLTSGKRAGHQQLEGVVIDWFTVVIVLALFSFVGGVLAFAWVMMKVIND